jgi:hypothetical protein
MNKVLSTDDPSTYAQPKEKTEWKKSMIAEYDSLMNNMTWTLVPLPSVHNLVGCKCIYKKTFTI